jgi:alkylresorcinol/alkylpyrone synthase
MAPLFHEASVAPMLHRFHNTMTPTSPQVGGTGTALPPHRYTQQDLAELATEVLPGIARQKDTLVRLFARVGVKHRHLALPAAAYRTLTGLEARNAAWLDVAIPLAIESLGEALNDAGLQPADVDALFTTTVTGIAVPSLDARLMNRLPFRTDLKRIPLFGLGCVAGAAGMARAAEYLRAFPDHVAVLLSVELCSLTLQHTDDSVANIISSGLFGDGAAATVLVGAEHPAARTIGCGPAVLDSLSRFFPDTERVMGWDVVDDGFKIVLSKGVPLLAREGLPPLVDELLARHELTRDAVAHWVAHPGGPAVVAAMSQGLDLPDDALAATVRSLADVGNLSSASVLFLLDDFRRHLRPQPDDYGLMLAMGPAFCAEAVLLQW